MSDADSYLTSLQNAYRANDHHKIAAHLDPFDSTSISQLQQGLNTAHYLRPSSYSSLAKTFFPDNSPFADFLAAYLLFVRDAHINGLDDSGTSAQRASNAFELFSTCYTLAISLVASQESTWFVPSLRRLANSLVILAFRADISANDFKNSQAGIAARLLTRSLSVCAAERGLDWPSKRNAVFFLANQTLKIYFKLNNLRLCDTVVKNTRDARDFLDSQYPKADRVTFYYYMGRMYLYQRRLRKAMLDLRKAFGLCTSRQRRNRRIILVYLVTASLPLGVFPVQELLTEYELQGQYGPLIEAVKAGNYWRSRAILDQWQEWHVAKGTYLLLREKLEVICWRNLARRTLFVTHSGNPQPATGPPTLSLKAFLATAKYAFNQPNLDLDDIEAMCASLLDQGYMKAYIHHSMQLLVLQKGNLFGFPPVSSVRMLGDEA